MLQPKTQTAEWIQKQDPYICCQKEIRFRPKDTCRLIVRAWKIQVSSVQSLSHVQFFATP